MSNGILPLFGEVFFFYCLAISLIAIWRSALPSTEYTEPNKVPKADICGLCFYWMLWVTHDPIFELGMGEGESYVCARTQRAMFRQQTANKTKQH